MSMLANLAHPILSQISPFSHDSFGPSPLLWCYPVHFIDSGKRRVSL